MSSGSSLKTRFAFKFTGNIFAVLFALISMVYISRTLGPEDFGRFDFITNNLKLIFDVATLQLPTTYFIWVSRKGHKENSDIATGITLYFSLLIIIVIAISILLAQHFNLATHLWPDIAPKTIWYAFIFTVVTFIYQLLVCLSDGKSLTVGLEKLRFLQNLIKTILIVGLVIVGLLNLHTYIISQTLVLIAAIAATALYLHSQSAFGLFSFKIWSFSKIRILKYLSFIKSFTRPLIFLMLVSFLFLYFDRWFLQLIGGAIEQGYFGLSDKLGTIAFIFTSAMTPLLSREFAYAYEEGNNARLISLFERIRIFLFITIVMSCFMSVQSKNIAIIVGGNKFENAFIPIAIMALFPIHQTFGQLSSSLLVATGQTRLYSIIGTVLMISSLPITYFLVAPASYLLPGMELGATGLAIKMLLVQIIGTNIQLYYNTRYLKISYFKWLSYQLIAIPFIYFISYFSSLISYNTTELLFGHNISSLNIRLGVCIFSGILYCILLIIIVYIKPAIAGISREEISSYVHRKIKITQ